MRFCLAVAAFLATFLGVSNLEAQHGTATAFVNTDFSHNREALAAAYQNNVRAILATDCSTIAASAEGMVGIPLSNCAELAELVRQSDVRACPARMELANVLRSGKVSRVGKPRNRRPGEMCLYKDNVPIMSLQCGNWVLVGVPPARRAESVPLAVHDTVFVDRPVEKTVVVHDTTVVKQSSWLRHNWGWVVGTLVAGGTACAIWCPRPHASSEASATATATATAGTTSTGTHTSGILIPRGGGIGFNLSLSF